MNISISKTHIIGIVLLVAMGVMMFGSGAMANPTHTGFSGGEHCHIRAGSIDSTLVTKLGYSGTFSASTDALQTIQASGTPVPGAGTVCAYSSIKYISSILRLIVIVVAGVMFVLAGFLYATSQGDTERQSRAKNILVTGVIGVFIALIATIFPSIAASFM